MTENDASDLHLTSGSPPFFRIKGEVVKSNHKALIHDEVKHLVFQILNEKQKKEFVSHWELDCSHQVEGLGRFRCNVFMQRQGLSAVFRHIPHQLKTLTQLNMPTNLYDLVNVHRGLVLVTGPTGSGKSTTMAALIDYINVHHKKHILTIEDPIEFVHANKNSLVSQREIATHTKSFSNALTSALREDPDVILVGELRDLESIQLALTAAETGHLVISTLHTSGAHKTVDRIIDVFPADRQKQIQSMLAESLSAVISQVLLQKSDGSGRVAALEVLVSNSAIKNLIREGKTYQIPSVMQTHIKDGMMPIQFHMRELVKRGLITQEDANKHLMNLGEKPQMKAA